MKSFQQTASALVVVLGLGFGGVAQAAVNPDGIPDALPAGQTNFLNSNPFGVDNQFSLGAASVVTSSLLVPFAGATFSGLLSSWVYTGDPLNTLGGLTFAYQITNVASSPAGIHRMTVNGFDGFGTLVSFIQGVGERRPTSVDRSGDGETVGWNFLPNPQCSPFGCLPTPGQLGAGQTSATLIIHTDAVRWGVTTAQFIDGSIATSPSFAPAAAIPEPETYALMLAGLGLMGFVARRRKLNS